MLALIFYPKLVHDKCGTNYTVPSTRLRGPTPAYTSLFLPPLLILKLFLLHCASPAFLLASYLCRPFKGVRLSIQHPLIQTHYIWR